MTPVRALKADYKASGGKLLRVRLKENRGRVESVQISGDFFLVPEDDLPRLEKMLIGAQLREEEIRLIVEGFFKTTIIQSLGVSPNDFVKALVSATEESNQ